MTTGAYQLLNLADAPAPALYEGKVVTDKTFGHATYGCMICCGYRGAFFDQNPIIANLSGGTLFNAIGYNACGGAKTFLNGYATSWWSDNNGIVTVTPRTATGVNFGSANANADMPNLPQRGIYDGTSCPVQDTLDSGPVNVGRKMPLITSTCTSPSPFLGAGSFRLQASWGTFGGCVLSDLKDIPGNGKCNGNCFDTTPDASGHYLHYCVSGPRTANSSCTQFIDTGFPFTSVKF